MDKIITIIYGGAFNPPTVAHEAILRACVNYALGHNADLWIVPSGTRFDKKISVDTEQRIKYIDSMLECVAPFKINIKIITNELYSDKIVRTSDTVKEFNKLYKDRSFFWVFGSDSIKAMPTWHNGKWLLSNLNMLVIERLGSDIGNLSENIKILKVPTIIVSSTEVRRCIDEGKRIDGLVSPAVLKAINKTTPPV